MTENNSTTTPATEALPCGHSRVDHLVQRIDMVKEMAALTGIVIPEGEELRYNVLSTIALVVDSQASDGALTAMADIAVALVRIAFPDSEDQFLSFAETVVNAAEANAERVQAAQG